MSSEQTRVGWTEERAQRGTSEHVTREAGASSGCEPRERSERHGHSEQTRVGWTEERAQRGTSEHVTREAGASPRLRTASGASR
jgi:hypothetical protein